MGDYIRIEGISEAIDRLELWDGKINSRANLALRNGADVAKESIKRHTPWGPERPKRKYPHGHARNNITSSNVKTNAYDYKSIDVGYNDDSYYYMWFLHEGTYNKGNPKGIRPRKHVEKAWKSAASEVENVIRETMASLFQ